MHQWQEIEPLMRDNWQFAISSLVSVDKRIFSGKHQACPHCRGKDRFRFDNEIEYKGDGGAYCNQCGAGSGMNWLMKLSGMDFKEALIALAGFLNMNPQEKREAVRKSMPKVGCAGDLSPEQVRLIMSKTTFKEKNAWTLRNGIGIDLQVISGKSGELVAVEVFIPHEITPSGGEFNGTPCNVAFIPEEGRVAFRGGYDKYKSIFGKVSRAGVTPIGKSGKFIYLVADYVDAWHAHYLTNACIWCCWTPENMWEVSRIFEDKSRLRAIINNNFDEIVAAENADLPIMLPDGSDRIRGASAIQRKIYSARELLDNKNPA